MYFVDDLNMPLVDKYDTQSAIELMRQSIDYRGWFDKSKILLKVWAPLLTDDHCTRYSATRSVCNTPTCFICTTFISDNLTCLKERISQPLEGLQLA